jgi:hypothetical protein
MEEIVAKCNARGYIAIGLAEIWRTGVEELTEHGCMLLSVGLKKQPCNRGSGRVATLLNEEGVVAFKKGGMVRHTDFESARVMAVGLVLEDKDGKDVGIHFMPAYAPQGDAPQAEWDNFFADLSACAARRVKGDVIMLSADINGAIGNNKKGGAQCCGKWDNPKVNASGERRKGYLLARQMVAVGTWFRKKEGGYGTWIHPKTKKLYQHDHFFMLREDMKRVTGRQAVGETQRCG